MSSPNSEVSSLSSLILVIDFRSGSVEMRLGQERYLGKLPMSGADCSQINTAGGTVETWEKVDFVPSPVAVE
jgi:hypothetical protein